MFRQRFTALFILIVLLFGSLSLTLAQDDSTPTQEVGYIDSDIGQGGGQIETTASESPSDSADSLLFTAQYLVSAVFVVLVIAILALILLAYKLAQMAGINISPESISAIATPIYASVDAELNKSRAEAKKTPGIGDDLLTGGLDITAEQLAKLLAKLNLMVISKPEAPTPNPTTSPS